MEWWEDVDMSGEILTMLANEPGKPRILLIDIDRDPHAAAAVYSYAAACGNVNPELARALLNLGLEQDQITFDQAMAWTANTTEDQARHWVSETTKDDVTRKDQSEIEVNAVARCAKLEEALSNLRKASLAVKGKVEFSIEHSIRAAAHQEFLREDQDDLRAFLKSLDAAKAALTSLEQTPVMDLEERL